jgi:hypothetical protein
VGWGEGDVCLSSQVLLYLDPSLRLALGVLRGRHAATRPLGRRAGIQHGLQKRAIQAVSAGGVKNRSYLSLEPALARSS